MTKKTVFVFVLILLAQALLVSAMISDPKLVDEATHEVIEKRYDLNQPGFYGDVDSSQNGGMTLYSDDLCNDLCSDEDKSICYEFDCAKTKFLCASYKVGDLFLPASSCSPANIEKGDWSLDNDLAYTTNLVFSFNTAPYPGQLFLVISDDNQVDLQDLFYLIPAPENGWLKGDNPNKDRKYPLSSYDISIEDVGGVARVKVLAAYSDNQSLINLSYNTQSKIIIGLGTSTDITGEILDSAIIYPDQTAVLYYGEYQGDLFVFVNGILEGRFYVKNITERKEVKETLRSEFPDEELLDDSGQYMDQEEYNPLDPEIEKPEKLSEKAQDFVITKPFYVRIYSNPFLRWFFIVLIVLLSIFLIYLMFTYYNYRKYHRHNYYKDK